MKTNDGSEQLDTQIIDYVASAAKSVLGAVPFAGSLIVELVGTFIPNQRLDRIAKYVKSLGEKIANLEQSFVRAKLDDENFSDLLEESLRQAGHSLSDERREYLASLVTNSLSKDDIDHIESRHLLRILGELNDIEIIWLAYYHRINTGNRNEFFEMHQEILTPVVATFGGGSSEIDREALQTSYKEHLSRLGLIKPLYKKDSRTNVPEFNRQTGALEINSYQLTPLGRLMLKQIGLINES